MTILGGPDKKMAQSQRFLVDEKMASRGRKRPEHANVARDLDGTPSCSQSFAGLGVDGDGLRSRQGSMEPPSSMRTRVDAFRGFGQSRVPPSRSRRDRRRLPRLRASRGRRGTPGRVWRRRGARRAALEGQKVVPSKNRPRIASLSSDIDAPPESISAVLAAEGRPERVSRAWQKGSSARATQPELWPNCITQQHQNTGRRGCFRPPSLGLS